MGQVLSALVRSLPDLAQLPLMIAGRCQLRIRYKFHAHVLEKVIHMLEWLCALPR